jgi:hypothetical protein
MLLSKEEEEEEVVLGGVVWRRSIDVSCHCLGREIFASVSSFPLSLSPAAKRSRHKTRTPQEKKEMPSTSQ